ncbi:hypothetical protein [Dyella silvatica]|uniref:hypothetical protein n=1 Tax=Dyella silvatica TaxID=2992128 RepID=UPI0022523E4D|nr:hypothetical protein [Dyella silvatica]
MNPIRFVRNCIRLVSTLAAGVMALTVVSPCLSFESPKTITNRGAELCVERLREIASPISGSIEINEEAFAQVWISGKDESQRFSSCINAAKVPWIEGYDEKFLEYVDNYSYGKRAGDGELIKYFQHYGAEGPRYILVDAYERKYLLDMMEKRSYELVRIPVPGSIEAKGHWDGVYDPGPSCLNSNGDPCGTKYGVGRTGWQKK